MIVFIDGSFVYSKSEHIDHLEVLLQVLKEQQLFDKYSKCDFFVKIG